MGREVNYIPLTTAAAYALVAGLWITISDRLLGAIIPSAETLTKVQQYKGWGFVLVTAVLLYSLLRGQIGEYRRTLISKQDLESQYGELEEKIADYFEISPVVGYVLEMEDQEVKLTWLSENVGEVLGVPGHEIEQTAFWEEKLQKRPELFQNVPETERAVFPVDSFTQEYRVEGERGTPRWVQDVYRVFLAGDGNPGKVVGALLDITDRVSEERQKEKFYRAMENTKDIVFITDREGVIEYVNPAFEEVTGYSEEEVIGSNPSILNSGKMGDDYYADFWERILKGEVVRGEVINRTKTGRHFSYDQTVTPIYDDLGQITHFVSTGRDTTEKNQLLVDIQARNEELTALNAISARFREAKSSVELLPLIAKEAKRLLRSDAVGLTLLNASRDQFRFVIADGYWEDKLGEVFPVGQGLSSKILITGEAYATPDYSQEELGLPAEQAAETGPALLVPLGSEEQIVGVLAVLRHLAPDAEPYTPAEVNLLATIGQMAGNTFRRLELYEDAERRLKQTQALHRIDLAITSTYDLDVALHVALLETTDNLGVDAAAVLSYDWNLNQLEYKAGRGFKTDAVLNTQIGYGEGWAGQAVQTRRVVSGGEKQDDLHGCKRQDVIQAEGFNLYYVAPLIVKGEVRGVLEVFNRTRFSVSEEWEDFLKTIAGEIAIAMESSGLFVDLERSNLELMEAYDETLEGWASALALRDEETEEHTQRVTALTVRIAQAMGINQEDLKHIRRGALLHDIGKMGIPDSILLKPGKLDAEEWEVMQQHPVLAYEMLTKIEHLRPAIDIPHFHHERWDGTGYPQGLQGEEIPLAARIFAVVDVWDALHSDRPYRKAWPLEKVLEHLRGEAGKHFDPEILEIFLEIVEGDSRLTQTRD